jgi:hypothetical protein
VTIEWKITAHLQNTYTIAGHYWPAMARVKLLDDIEKVYYQPIGSNMYREILYIKCPYPISHTCAAEQEREDAIRTKQVLHQTTH